MSGSRLLVVMILIGPANFLSPTNRNEDVVTCLGARRKCEYDVTCKVFLDTVSKVCDESTDTCETTQRLHCISVLTTLQSSPYFRGCTCDPLGEFDQYRQCRRLRTLIFAHLCIRWSDHVTFGRYGSNNDSAVTSVHRAPHNLSCLEAKKKCGLDPECFRLINDLRSQCKESKTANQCAAQDWQSCYTAVVSTFSRHRYLADCGCPRDASSDVREMCEKVRTKITGNACIDLGFVMEESWRSLHFVVCPGSFLLSSEYKVLPSDSMTYEHLLAQVDKFDSSAIESHHCTKAFSGCHSDVTCRSRAVKIADTCRNTSEFLKR